MNKKKIIEVILVIGIILMSLAGYLYYKQKISESKEKQTVFNTTTEEGDNTENINSSDVVTETQGIPTDEAANTTNNEGTIDEINQEVSATTEKRKNTKLPDNYEWNEKQWGEPPQIVYDFEENQEKFDLIVKEVDALISEEEGFTTKISINGLYYHSKHKNIENKLSDKFKENATYLFKNTKFYQFTKIVDGHWLMYYDQEEDRERYIYYMAYAPEMTEEEAWENGYMKVVGGWYFATLWKI